MLNTMPNRCTQEQIVCIDDLVPKNHMLRKIDRAIDWSFIYDLVKDKYCLDNGRQSIDPVTLIKIPIIQYLFGIKSMRQTIKEIEVNVAYRWFLGLDLTDKIPHFSTFSKNYTRRFKDTDIFEKIFARILEECISHKLVNTKEIFVDATLPAGGKNTSIGYNRYSMTFNKAINTLSLKLGETDITDYTISDDKKTVEFGVNLPTAGSKTLTASVTDSKGTEITLTRTLRVKSDGWVAYTDFDGSLSGEGEAWRYVQNTEVIKMSQAVTHSGNWSIYSTTGFTGDAHTYLQPADWSSTFWNSNVSPRALTVGEKYKYSYWVYADEAAAVTTPKVLVKKADGTYNWLILNFTFALAKTSLCIQLHFEQMFKTSLKSGIRIMPSL